MKKIVSFLMLAAVLCASVLTSCKPKVLPDNKAEIVSIELRRVDNPALSADIVGSIDALKSTITFVVPTSVEARSFVPVFTLSENDVLTQNGKPIVSGLDAISLEGELVVSDEYSVLKTTYTIVVLANDEKAELLSISFAAADNELLSEDVAPEAIASNMIARVPAAAFQQSLVLSLSAGEGDVILVNKEVVSAGKVSVDTKFPVDIEVKDEVANLSTSYVLKVGKILAYEATKLGSYSKEGTTMGYNIALAVNPVDKAPYIMVDAKEEGAAKAQFSVVKWNGSGFETVGNTSFSETTATASAPGLSFASDGTAFASYKGGSVSNCYAVHKLESGEWTMLGAKEATGKANSATVTPVRPIIDGKGAPAIIYSGSTKNTPSFRTANISKFNGSWSESVMSGIPAYETSTAGAFYGYSWVSLNGANYVLMHFNQHGFYVYKLGDDNSLSPIVENYIAEGDTYALPGNATLCTDGKDLYLMEASQSAQKMAFYKVDVESKAINQLTSSIPVTISSKGAITEYMTFAVNSDEGCIAVVGEQNVAGETRFSFAISDEDKVLGDFAVLSESTPRNDAFIQYAGDNTFYVALSCKDADSNCFVELYKIAYEADILPE